MEKRNWKIVYSDYKGLEKKAVELIYRELGSYLLRDAGIYRIHTLLCEKESDTNLDKNCVVIGLYDESLIIREYIDKQQIKKDGYVIKVTESPAGYSLVIITANTPSALFYGAVDFVDDYLNMAAPMHGSLKLVHEVLDSKLPEFFCSSAPAVKTRSVFTWGHPINDYKNYIENMARLKLNQLIIWNDYLPVNAKDVVDYAHEYGIELIWGYAWGWSRACNRIHFSELERVKAEVIEKYEKYYANSGADGIYFQSFTETKDDNIDGELIAKRVVEFVNSIAEELFKRNPDVKIQFGLHATSVKDHLSFISDVDKRLEIVWEDCGSFPFGYHPQIRETDDFEGTLDFTDQIINLRKDGDTSFLFKGFMTLDWHGDRFVHQTGPYIMGCSSESVIKQDAMLLSPIWRQYQSGWIQNGQFAHTVARFIVENSLESAAIGMAGQFSGGRWLPEALCAQILWDCDKPYDEIINKVTRRTNLDIV